MFVVFTFFPAFLCSAGPPLATLLTIPAFLAALAFFAREALLALSGPAFAFGARRALGALLALLACLALLAPLHPFLLFLPDWGTGRMCRGHKGGRAAARVDSAAFRLSHPVGWSWGRPALCELVGQLPLYPKTRFCRFVVGDGACRVSGAVVCFSVQTRVRFRGRFRGFRMIGGDSTRTENGPGRQLLMH